MTNEFSPDEKAHIDEVLKRMRSKDRKSFPAKEVKRFRQAISAELQKTGELKKDAVDRLLIQLKSGEL